MTDNILHIALHKVYAHLDKLVEECVEDGKPTRKTLAKARACLPSTYKMGFKKK